MRNIVYFASFRLLVLAALFFASPAYAADVSASMAGQSAVIEFSLDEKIAYTVKLAGGSLIVRFDKQIDIEPAVIKTSLPEIISDVVFSGDGKTLIIGMNYPVTLDDQQSGNVIKIVVTPIISDKKPEASKPPAESQPAPVAAQPPETKPEIKTEAKAEELAPMQNMRSPVIRTAQHPKFYRVVFDWPSPVKYNLLRADNKLSITFDQPLKIPEAQLKKIKLKACDVTQEVVENKIKVNFACNGVFSTDDFINQNSVVIDFMLGVAPKENTLAPTSKALERKAPAKQLDSATESKFPLPASERISTDKVPDTEELPTPLPQKDIIDDPSEILSLPLTVTKTDKVLSFKFDWPKPVALAVFKRAGFAWMVFDRPSKIVMNKDSQSVLNIIGGMDVMNVPNATVLRIHSVTGLEGSVQKSGDTWQMDFRSQKMNPSVSIPSEYKQLTDGKNRGLYLTVPESGRVFRVDDAEVGDYMIVATVRTVGRGVNGERDFPEFTLLSSTQGIAIVPRIEDLQINPDFEGFTISNPRGLALSSPDKPETNETQKTEDQPEIYGPLIDEGSIPILPILKYAEWRGDPKRGFFDKEKELLFELGKLGVKDRSEKRLELAKLYFAYGWMNEAAAVLNVAASGDDMLMKSAELLAIRGAAEIMQGNLKAAAEDLKDQRFDTQSDVATWRGVLAVAQNDWAASDQYFTMSDQPNLAPPPNAKKLIGLAQIESEVSNGHLEQAKTIIERMDKDSELSKVHDILNYWRGEIALAEEKPDLAEKIWNRVVKSEEPYARPRAEFALIKHGFDSGTVTRADAIARLERLRFAWRGDKFEFYVLKKLGQMQIEDSLYREGLYTLRRAVTNYADQPYASELGELMTDTFKKLFLDGTADNMPPLTALGLFDEFRDLTPTGPDGDRIIQKLADRMISVDLLERAADLLSHQVTYRLQGEDKAQAGAKLAFVYLLDRKPEDAIKVIDLSNAAQLSDDLASQRRLLKARALFDLGKPQDALDLIAKEEAQEADLLRADIYWRMRNWPLASEKLQKLVDREEDEAKTLAKQPDDNSMALAESGSSGQATADENKLPAEVSGWVLSLALAKALEGNNEALQSIKRKYWSKMKSTPQFDAFEIITNVDATQPMTLSELSGTLQEASKLENFINFYRNKIKKGSLSSPK